MELQPLVLINAVGLTPKLLAFAPRLKQLAAKGWHRSLHEVVPAVTCTAQASHLDRRASAGAWDRRQRLAVPRDAARSGSGSSRTP